MKQTRLLSEFSCLSEYTRLYPIGEDKATSIMIEWSAKWNIYKMVSINSTVMRPVF